VSICTFRNFFSGPTYSADEWAEIALLAHKYIMTDIEAGALTQLKSSSPPFDRIKIIEISQKIQSKELYQQAVREFVESRSKIRFEDVCKIGVEAFYDIYSLSLYGSSDRPGAPNFNPQKVQSHGSLINAIPLRAHRASATLTGTLIEARPRAIQALFQHS
jgi:hypothetical protein